MEPCARSLPDLTRRLIVKRGPCAPDDFCSPVGLSASGSLCALSSYPATRYQTGVGSTEEGEIHTSLWDAGVGDAWFSVPERLILATVLAPSYWSESTVLRLESTTD